MNILCLFYAQRADNSVKDIYINESTLTRRILIWINKMLTLTYLPFVCVVETASLAGSVSCVLSLSRLARMNGVVDLDLLLLNSLMFPSSILNMSDYVVTFKARPKFSTAITLTVYYITAAILRTSNTNFVTPCSV
jgi:hypothetical protein